MKNLITLLRSGGGQAVASSGTVLLLTVATGVLSARLLEVQDRGVAASLLALGAMLAQAGSAGPAETQLLAPRRGIPLGVVVRVTWVFSLVYALLAAIPSVAYLSKMAEIDPRLLAIVSTMPLISATGMMCNYLLIGEARYGRSTLVRMSPVIVQTMALIFIWFMGIASVINVLVASWFASLFAGLLGLALAKPWTHRGGTFRESGRSIIRLIMTVGSAHAIRIVGLRLDLILLGALSGGYAAGLYSVAISLTSAGTSLTANLAPLVTTRGEGQDSARFTQAASFFAGGIALGIAALGPLVIPLVYGRDYAPGWSLITILAASMYGAFLFDTAGRIFQRAGHERIALRVSVLVLVIQLIAISIGALTLGAPGAALGNFLAYAVGLLVFAFAARTLQTASGLAHQLSPMAGLRVCLARLRHG